MYDYNIQEIYTVTKNFNAMKVHTKLTLRKKITAIIATHNQEHVNTNNI